MQKIASGAEAIVYSDNEIIIKERISKSYRIPELDSKLIRSRTKKESKILTFLHEKQVNVPKLIKTEENRIYMERIDGEPLKKVLNEENYKTYMNQVGILVAKIHNLDVVHGDLTTMNFILKNENLQFKDMKVYAIDFGLSFNTRKDEDKAVDLYVFERAIKCGHKEEYLIPFYESYAKEGSESVLKKLENVRLRGRKREDM